MKFMGSCPRTSLCQLHVCLYSTAKTNWLSLCQRLQRQNSLLCLTVEVHIGLLNVIFYLKQKYIIQSSTKKYKINKSSGVLPSLRSISSRAKPQISRPKQLHSESYIGLYSYSIQFSVS